MIMRDSVDEEPSYSSYGFSYRHTTGQSAPAAVTLSLSPSVPTCCCLQQVVGVCYRMSKRCVTSLALPSYNMINEIVKSIVQ